MTMTVGGTTGLTFPDSSTQATAATGFGFKNRIINGAMMIDQRNAGASVTPTNASYTLDRWKSYVSQASKFTVQQNAGSVTPPSGFVNYLGATSSSAYSVTSNDYFTVGQFIEGLNLSDLGWGAAGAASVTLSFWVRSSLTGTFGGSVGNYDGTRSYPFTYAIGSANTWTNVSVTIPGDTSGTWLKTNGTGMILYFSLGAGSTFLGTVNTWASANYVAATGSTSVVGTNGATFYITGVQLEKGSTATSFDYRPYGTELVLCQRYYWKGSVNAGGVYGGSGGSVPIVGWSFPVSMRSAPSCAWISGGTSSNGNANYTLTGLTAANTYTESAQILFSQTGTTGANTQGSMVNAAVCSFTAEL